MSGIEDNDEQLISEMTTLKEKVELEKTKRKANINMDEIAMATFRMVNSLMNIKPQLRSVVADFTVSVCAANICRLF